MISKTLFFLLLLCLPINLGLHFVIPEAYVTGILSDYLVPAIYVQDILIFLLLASWIFTLLKIKDHSSLAFLLDNKINGVTIFYLVSVLFSVLLSSLFISSLYAFIRLVLYIGMFFYIQHSVKPKKFFDKYFWFIAIATLFVSVLGILQFAKQSSVFNNYKFLGEQPYTFSTPGIVRDNFFGFSKVPAYGLFRHPNTFGGYLSIVLIWFIAALLSKRYSGLLRNLLLLVTITGAIALFLTLSYFSWIAFVVGSLFYVLWKSKFLTRVLACTLVIVCLSLMFLPIISDYTHLGDIPTFYRRTYLLKGGYSMVRNNYFYGVGYNNSTVVAEQYTPRVHDIRFNQPVHNIFMLNLVESGIFAFTFYLLLILLVLRRSFMTNNKLLFISILQLIFLGSLDHYLLTIHQTQILFWILLGLGA